LLADAIAASKESSEPITLLVVIDGYYKTCSVNYHGGKLYPHLAREESKPDYLDELASAHAAGH
jgi:hypothetical protein